LNYLIQGVTTVRTGSDGSGTVEIAKTKSEWESNGLGTNAVMFAGFNVVRREVMRDDQLRAPKSDELERMQSLVRKCMQEGAWGISTGLEYGGYNIHVTTDEVIEVTKPVAEYSGVYISQMRDEASKILEAIEELIKIGEGAGVPVNITHLKATGRDNWGLMRDVVNLVNESRARGVRITADQYPFLQGSPIDYITALIDIPSDVQPLAKINDELPDYESSFSDHVEKRKQFVRELQKSLRDPVKRKRLRQSTYEKRPADPSAVARWGWEDFRIKVAVKNAHLIEKNVAEIIDETGRDGFDIIADLILDEPDVLFASASQSHDDMRHALQQEWVMVSSDGGTFPPTKPDDPPVRGHPRPYASQSIVLRKYVREEKLLSLEEAVRKMTSLPAQFLKMKDRGLLREGYKADIVIFNRETISDHATYADSRRYATGVEYVLVNGKVSVEKGKHNGALHGKVLLKR
jgi:N-acyl-D-aspartate/D-glutamate deacylase